MCKWCSTYALFLRSFTEAIVRVIDPTSAHILALCSCVLGRNNHTKIQLCSSTHLVRSLEFWPHIRRMIGEDDSSTPRRRAVASEYIGSLLKLTAAAVLGFETRGFLSGCNDWLRYGVRFLSREAACVSLTVQQVE